jgi:hypothetical protein
VLIVGTGFYGGYTTELADHVRANYIVVGATHPGALRTSSAANPSRSGCSSTSTVLVVPESTVAAA